MYLRLNRPEDTAEILAMRDHVESWLDQRGEDQFNDDTFTAKSRVHIQQLLDDQRFAVLTSGDGTPIHAVGALVGPDRDFWHQDDDLETAWYVARLMVREHGRRYGEQLLDLIAVWAQAAGAKWLRLDCWRQNERLHDYYRANGFQLVRVEEVAWRKSGALFARELVSAVPTPWNGEQRGAS